VLEYLDAMIAAITVRDGAAVDRLLAHPLVRILPHAARAEVEALRHGAPDAPVAPLRLMQLRHQTAELLREAPLVADRAEPSDNARPSARVAPRPAARGRLVQMELPLSA